VGLFVSVCCAAGYRSTQVREAKLGVQWGMSKTSQGKLCLLTFGPNSLRLSSASFAIKVSLRRIGVCNCMSLCMQY